MRLTHEGVALPIITALVYAFLYLPIIVLVAFSFNSARISAGWTGFTLAWYHALFEDASVRMALANSLKVSVAAAALSTAIGTAAAYALNGLRGRAGAAIRAVIYLPLIVPDIVIGVALVTLYTSVSLELGINTLIFSHLVFDSAYVTIIVLSRLSVYDAHLEEAAADLGASPLRVFITVRLPLILPSVVAGTLLAFTLSFDDFIISLMTSGVGATTLPVKIYSMTRFGVSPAINALSTLIVAFTAFSIYLVHRLSVAYDSLRDDGRQSRVR
jgi:spermidine/putrescine transport system permease protein